MCEGPSLLFFFPAWWSVWTNTGRWISEWFSFAIVSRKFTINPSTHSQWFFWFPNKHIYWPFPSVRLVWISMQMQHLLVLRTQVELHLIFYYKDTSWVAFTFLKKKMMFWLNGLAMSELWNNSQEPSKIDGALFSYMVFITCGGDTSFLTFFIFVPPNWSRYGCWYFAKHSNNLLIFEHVMQCCQIWLYSNGVELLFFGVIWSDTIVFSFVWESFQPLKKKVMQLFVTLKNI